MFDRLSKIRFKGDGIIWMVFFFLCIVSVLEVYSASSALTYKGGSYWAPVVYHTILLLIGVGFMVLTMNIKCKYFKLVTPFALLFSLVMLIAVLFMGRINGAARWFSLFGIQFQPSELAKGAVILAVAQILSAMQTVDGADRRAFKYILYVSVPVMMLIAVENLSTAALLFLTVAIMMFIGRVPRQQIGRMFGFLAICGVVLFATIWIMGSAPKESEAGDERLSMTEQVDAAETAQPGALAKVFHRFDTWKARIQKFLSHEDLRPEDIDLDKDAQVAHANIAIASSNVVGKGPGNSVERDFLSQAFSDFIYAIIIEEMGIWGAAGVCLLYIILLFRTATIANRCANAFLALLIMGIALLLVTQAMFNMCVAVGLAPVTGQPLPLISKGGTSTIVNCVYMGVILSVSYTAKHKDDVSDAKKPRALKATA